MIGLRAFKKRVYMQLKKMNRFFLVTASLLAAGLGDTLTTQAQVGATSVITTAAPSLRIPTDARATGMGNTGIATSADATSAYWNVAKAPFAEKQTAIAANYSPWQQQITSGMYLLGLSAYHRLDTLQAVTASVRYFNMGNFQLKDADGNIMQSARPHEMSFDLGYARKLSERLALGIAFRYINSSLASGTYNGTTYKAGQAFAADIGVYYNGHNSEGQGFSAGMAFSNIGSRISYTNDATHKDFLPANLGIGAAYTVVPDEENTITFAADINKLLVPSVPMNAADSASYYSSGVLKGLGKGFGNSAWSYGAGVEYTYHKLLSLRAGYFGQSVSAGDQKGFTAGLGLQFRMLAINLSYLAPTGNGGTGSQNPLSNTLRFGVVFDFGK